MSRARDRFAILSGRQVGDSDQFIGFVAVLKLANVRIERGQSGYIPQIRLYKCVECGDIARSHLFFNREFILKNQIVEVV